MRLRMIVAFLVASSATVLTQSPVFQFTLPSTCRLPFFTIAPTADAFAKCDNLGRMTGQLAPALPKRLQAAAKNNLCANASSPMPMHFEDFARLEANIDLSQLDLSTTRGELALVGGVIVHGKEVGEGTVVQLVAMMRSAHISDCRKVPAGKKGGEAVNCNTLGTSANDLHIVLMPLGSDDHTSECDSVTAEIIPHFRPAAWAQIDLKTPTANPVRITGPLFYDDAHRACVNGKGSPARSTVWEIHPAYQIEVCTGTTEVQCDVADPAAWTPYDRWVTQAGSSTTATGEQARRACESAAPPST